MVLVDHIHRGKRGQKIPPPSKNKQTNKTKQKENNWPLKINSLGNTRIPFTTPFLVARHDGETFVKEVDANYVLWEQQSRGGFEYSATMKQV